MSVRIEHGFDGLTLPNRRKLIASLSKSDRQMMVSCLTKEEAFPLVSHGEHFFSKMSEGERRRFDLSLDTEQRRVIDNDWGLWALPHQRMPPIDIDNMAWSWWVSRCGRGGGKTFSGSKATNEVAAHPEWLGGGTIQVLHTTDDSAEKIAIYEPDSGIIATAPEGFKPTYKSSKSGGMLEWPNGVIGYVSGVGNAGAQRGPNVGWLWWDEPDHSKDPDKVFWEVIWPAVRKGMAAAMLTTTPANKTNFLSDLESRAVCLRCDWGGRAPKSGKCPDCSGEIVSECYVTRASMMDNPWLKQKTRKRFIRQYGGTRRARQELDGDFLESLMGALWTSDVIDRNRVTTHPTLVRALVSVDPAGSNKKTSDETGIVVVGLGEDGHGYVLCDRTGKYRPEEWAEIACNLKEQFACDFILGERNYGGDMVKSTIRAYDRRMPYEDVTAKKSKWARADDVATLYEMNEVHHVGEFKILEDEQTSWIPGSESPNSMDAAVHGLKKLMLEEDQKAGVETFL